MTRTRLLVLAVAAALAAAGCGETAQTAAGSKKKADDKPWENAGGSYVAGNWKSGDEKAWEEQLRARAQSQNEYARSAVTTTNP